jgi:hypothetical protein
MLTPKNITELKSTVRGFLAANPDMRRTVAILADTESEDLPDLFGWVRMWCAVQILSGAEEETVKRAVLRVTV